jgi:tetratricopeptide (TPR) repeat protein
MEFSVVQSADKPMMRDRGGIRGHQRLKRWLLGGSTLVYAAALWPGFAVAGASGPSTYERTILEIQKEIEAGNLEAARALVVEAEKNYPHNGGVENLLGVVEVQQGHAAAASKAFSQAIVDDPRLTAAYLNLSRIKMESASSDQPMRAEALRLSLKVLELDPTNDEAHYQAATLLFWDRDYHSSLQHLGKLSPESRAKVGAQALLCADYAALGDRKATDEAARALAANPDLTEADVDTCIPKLREARRADLIDTLLTAAQTHQALSPEGLRVLGLAQEAEGQLQLARATLEKAFAAKGTSVAILEDLTRVARAASDNQGALGYLAHARDLAPNNAALAYEFGAVCVRMGLYAEARKAIAEALRLEPDNAEYNLGMGMVVSFSSDPSQALPFLTKFYSLRPNDPEGVLALGAANFRAKDYDAASPWLTQAVGSPKTAADAHYYLGRIARQEGRLDEATAQLKQSLAIEPDRPDTLAELGEINLQARDFVQAAAYFDQALHHDPDNYVANFGLLQLYARTGDSRREQQSHRFDEIKNQKEERDHQMMRSLEIRRNDLSDESK